MATISLRGLAAKALSAAAQFVGPVQMRTRDGGTLPGGPWSRFGGSGWGRIRRFLPGSNFDWEAEAGELWMNSVVALGIQWIGDRVARPELKVFRRGRGGKEIEVHDHGILQLWNRPNPFYGRRQMEKAIVLSLKCDGNAYIYKLRDRGGRVCQLWWIPHFRCQPLWPEDGGEFEDGYRISVDGQLRDVPETDVIHIRDGIDPLNDRLGLSPLKACIREVCTVNAETIYTAAILKNSGVPSLAIIPEGGGGAMRGPAPNPDTAERAKEKILDELTGDDAGGITMFSGAYKLVEVGYSPEKLVLDKLPVSAVARVASAVGVNAMSLGLPDPNKTYSNFAEANRASWGTLVATQELVAEALRDDLATDAIQVDGRVTEAAGPLDLAVRYDYGRIQELQESLDAMHKRVRDDFAADLIRRVPAQEALGYEPDPDEVEGGGPYYSEIKAAMAPAPPPPEDPGTEEEADQVAADAKTGAKSWRY